MCCLYGVSERLNCPRNGETESVRAESQDWLREHQLGAEGRRVKESPKARRHPAGPRGVADGQAAGLRGSLAWK